MLDEAFEGSASDDRCEVKGSDFESAVGVDGTVENGLDGTVELGVGRYEGGGLEEKWRP